jgi:nitroreductase
MVNSHRISKTMAEKDIFSEIPQLNYQEDNGNFENIEAFEKLVAARRSCRVYTEEPVPEAIVRKCLSMALLAPNSSNLQPWQFYWVRNADKKQQVVEACLSQPAAATAQELIIAVSHPQMWRTTRKLMLESFAAQTDIKVPKAAISYYDKLVPLAYNQGFLGLFGKVKSLILFFRGLKKPTPRGPVSRQDMRVWGHKSTALACQQLMLAFRAHGYDTCPMEGMDEKRIRKIIDMPSGSEVCMVISVGKRAQNGIYGPRIRFDEKLFVHEV